MLVLVFSFGLHTVLFWLAHTLNSIPFGDYRKLGDCSLPDRGLIFSNSKPVWIKRRFPIGGPLRKPMEGPVGNI